MTEPQQTAKDDKPTETPQQRLGRILKNPFFNFLRELRKNTQGMTMIASAVKGAEIWRNMSQSEREPYYLMARQASSRKRKKSKVRSDLLTTNNPDHCDESVSKIAKAKRRKSRSRSKRKRSRSHSKGCQ